MEVKVNETSSEIKTPSEKQLEDDAQETSCDLNSSIRQYFEKRCEDLSNLKPQVIVQKKLNGSRKEFLIEYVELKKSDKVQMKKYPSLAVGAYADVQIPGGVQMEYPSLVGASTEMEKPDKILKGNPSPIVASRELEKPDEIYKGNPSLIVASRELEKTDKIHKDKDPGIEILDKTQKKYPSPIGTSTELEKPDKIHKENPSPIVASTNLERPDKIHKKYSNTISECSKYPGTIGASTDLEKPDKTHKKYPSPIGASTELQKPDKIHKGNPIPICASTKLEKPDKIQQKKYPSPTGASTDLEILDKTHKKYPSPNRDGDQAKPSSLNSQAYAVMNEIKAELQDGVSLSSSIMIEECLASTRMNFINCNWSYLLQDNSTSFNLDDNSAVVTPNATLHDNSAQRPKNQDLTFEQNLDRSLLSLSIPYFQDMDIPSGEDFASDSSVLDILLDDEIEWAYKYAAIPLRVLSKEAKMKLGIQENLFSFRSNGQDCPPHYLDVSPRQYFALRSESISNIFPHLQIDEESKFKQGIGESSLVYKSPTVACDGDDISGKRKSPQGGPKCGSSPSKEALMKEDVKCGSSSKDDSKCGSSPSKEALIKEDVERGPSAKEISFKDDSKCGSFLTKEALMIEFDESSVEDSGSYQSSLLAFTKALQDLENGDDSSDLENRKELIKGYRKMDNISFQKEVGTVIPTDKQKITEQLPPNRDPIPFNSTLDQLTSLSKENSSTPQASANLLPSGKKKQDPSHGDPIPFNTPLDQLPSLSKENSSTPSLLPSAKNTTFNTTLDQLHSLPPKKSSTPQTSPDLLLSGNSNQLPSQENTIPFNTTPDQPCSSSSEAFPVKLNESEKLKIPLKFTALELSWGTTRLGLASRKKLQVRNFSNQICSFHFKSEGPGFRIAQESSSCVALEPQEHQVIEIVFCPFVTGAALGAICFSIQLKGASANLDFRLPLYGYGGHSKTLISNLLRGPCGQAFIRMGNIEELFEPLETSFNVSNRGNLVGFAFFNLNTIGLKIPRLIEAFELKPSHILIPPGESIEVSITFQPQRNDVRRIFKKIDEVLTIATIEMVTGDEPNRQRIRNLLRGMKCQKRPKLATNTLKNIWKYFPKEEKILDVDQLKENRDCVRKLLKNIKCEQIAVTLNRCTSNETIADLSISFLESDEADFHTINEIL